MEVPPNRKCRKCNPFLHPLRCTILLNWDLVFYLTILINVLQIVYLTLFCILLKFNGLFSPVHLCSKWNVQAVINRLIKALYLTLLLPSSFLIAPQLLLAEMSSGKPSYLQYLLFHNQAVFIIIAIPTYAKLFLQVSAYTLICIEV